MKKILKRMISVVALVIIFVILLDVISDYLHTNESISHELISGFYSETDDSLDAVFLGPSCEYMFYEPPLAWKHYGIKTWSFASPGQPFEASRYLIEEAKKTQPNVLFVITVNDLLNDDINENRIHWTTDFMPDSENKIRLINQLLQSKNDDSFFEKFEYYFPVLRFHSLWSDFKLSKLGFNGCKGGTISDIHLSTIKDVSNEFVFEKDKYPLPQNLTKKLNDILDFCEESNTNVLFLTAPANSSASDIDDIVKSKQFNTINEIIHSRGFATLNTMDKMDEIGLDLSTDYYDKYHTNIHGAVKYTSYIARYLVEHYHLTDKRKSDNSNDWDKGYEEYVTNISPYTLPFEYTDDSWDLSLSAPEIKQSDSDNTVIEWNDVDGADGYGIFIKDDNNAKWSLLKKCTSKEKAWKKDPKVKDCIVVAYKVKNNTEVWGKYDVVKICNST